MNSSLESFLILGSTRDGAIELAYEKAFLRQGFGRVQNIDLERQANPLARNRILNRLTLRVRQELVGSSLYRHLNKNHSSYSVVIVFKGMQLSPTWLGACKKSQPRATWVNINPDDPFNVTSNGSSNRNVLSSIRQYDIYVTWGKHLVDPIRSAGCQNVLFLPFAYDVESHFPAEAHDLELAGSVTFVGTWDKERERILEAVADLPLRVYGNFWDRIGPRSPLRGKVHPRNLYGADLRRVVSSSRASLNILRPQNYGAHNMRTFEIPAMRGLMVTTRSEGQEEFFPDGDACLMFKDARDLRVTLERALGNQFDTEGMKETALRYCRGHSYDERARYLWDAITLYRQTGRVA